MPPKLSAARISASHASSRFDATAASGHDLAQDPVVHHVGQPVAAEQVDIAGRQRRALVLDLDRFVQADGADYDVVVGGP